MDVLISIYFFIFGTIIGSFLNVVSLRWNTGMTLEGRSKCFSCGKKINWYELIPILSFLFQKGRCAGCGSRISYQYPFVEFITGLLFVLIFIFFKPENLYGYINFIFYIVISCILLLITVYDIKHKIIPDVLSYSFSLIAFLHIFFVNGVFAIPPMYEVFSGIIVAIPFALLWFISKGRWMGFGDAKLVVGIGYTLGLFGAVSSIILSFWIGAFFGVLWLVFVVKRFKKGYEIPFGPYLILSMYIILFTGIKIIDIPLLFSI